MLTSQGSISRSDVLNGDWGLLLGPRIVNFTAWDPDNDDSFYSNGDRLTIGFSEPTNEPDVSNKTAVDWLFSFGGRVSLGNNYTGEWTNGGRDVVIHLLDVVGATSPVVNATRVSVLERGMLLNAGRFSLPSVAQSDRLTGDFGQREGPFMTELRAWGDANDAIFSDGDQLIFTFSEPTNQPDVSNSSAVESLFAFSQDGAGGPMSRRLLSHLNVSLGHGLVGNWTSPSQLVVTVMNTSGATVPRIGSFTVDVLPEAGLKDAEEKSFASRARVVLSTGHFGTLAGPQLLQCVANDHDDLDAKWSAGDTLLLVFAEPTNEPVVGSKAALDHLFNFSVSIGNDYTGSWLNSTHLLITLTDVPSSVGVSVIPRIGDLVVSTNFPNPTGVKNQAETSLETLASVAVSGDWGQKQPEIVKVVYPSSPFILVGDKILVIFDVPTNQPIVATKEDVDRVVQFCQPIAKNYTGRWINGTHLELDVLETLEQQPDLATLCVSANITNELGTIPPGNVNAPPPSGGSLSVAGPEIVSLVAVDPDNMDNFFSVGDQLWISFDVATNQPSVSTTAEINNLIAFTSLFGSEMNATWVNATLLVVETRNLTGVVNAPGFGEFNVSVRTFGGMTTADGKSRFSNGFSPKLTGSWGTFVPPPAGSGGNILTAPTPQPVDLTPVCDIWCVLGIIGGVLAMCILFFCVFLWRRRRKNRVEMEGVVKGGETKDGGWMVSDSESESDDEDLGVLASANSLTLNEMMDGKRGGMNPLANMSPKPIVIQSRDANSTSRPSPVKSLPALKHVAAAKEAASRMKEVQGVHKVPSLPKTLQQLSKPSPHRDSMTYEDPMSTGATTLSKPRLPSLKHITPTKLANQMSPSQLNTAVDDEVAKVQEQMRVGKMNTSNASPMRVSRAKSREGSRSKPRLMKTIRTRTASRELPSLSQLNEMPHPRGLSISLGPSGKLAMPNLAASPHLLNEDSISSDDEEEEIGEEVALEQVSTPKPPSERKLELRKPSVKMPPPMKMPSMMKSPVVKQMKPMQMPSMPSPKMTLPSLPQMPRPMPSSNAQRLDLVDELEEIRQGYGEEGKEEHKKMIERVLEEEKME
eukprot:TRINITY_DN897_c0_g3_i9.p1 TRINITY_DN897_c0_g3~~TRINITY_DN897_c0_g3_i9.p1  ORF type:complete len:1090 (+),score=343.75 TRINITY_DN897_c0_g3_i9:1589-4858(+)